MVSLLKDRSLIYIKGAHSTKFLQNLLTNDIESPDPFYSYILSAQGRFLFDVFVIKHEYGYLLDVYEPTKDGLIDTIDMYSINQDIELENFKPGSKVYYSKEKREDVDICYKDSRYVRLGYRFASSEDLGDDDSYLEDKYEYSIPDGGIDLIHQKSLAPEYGAEELCAASFTKGCYVGQEVMSRTKHLGEVRKHIYKIKGSSLGNAQYGSEIIQNGKKIGIFCSGHEALGIGLIRSQNIAESGEILLEGKPIIIEKAVWYS